MALASPRAVEAEALAANGVGVQPLLATAGAKVLFRGSVSSTLAGENPPASILVLEFEDSSAARGLFESASYLRLLPVREKAFARMEIFEVG